MAINDQVLRSTSAGTKSFFWPASVAANYTISTTDGNGTPTVVVSAYLSGNSANATIAANAALEIYAGNAVNANTLIGVLAGNSGLASPTTFNFPLDANAGNITLRTFGNTGSGWISYDSGGSNGQTGRL